jgi:hypothetical protein
VDTQTPAGDACIVLAGQPSLREFIRFHRLMAVDGQSVDEGLVAGEWRRANDYVRALNVREAGYADDHALAALPEEMATLAEAQLRDPAVQRAFCHVPCRWHMVELDRMVVYQRHVNLAVVADFKAKLPRAPTGEELFRLAMGQEQRGSAAQVTQVTDNVFSMAVGPVDARVLDIVSLDPRQVQGYTASGDACAMIAVFVGFPINCMNALRFGSRLILCNGSHRAYALRELGITHVPCLVRYVSTDEEMELVAAPEVKQNLHLYTKSARPPLFKDYFEPPLHKIVEIPRFNRLLQVQINTQQMRTQEARPASAAG